MDKRTAEVSRKTGETDISMNFCIDGSGKAEISTGIGFFDHMMDAFTRHGLFDMQLKADGDLNVDGHHTVEDTGIVLGQAIKEAVGDKKGIKRYGFFVLPMDEALILCAVDLCGRPYFVMEGTPINAPMVGDFDTELVREFFYSVSYSAAMNLHFRILSGTNAHHIIEGMFKCFSKALDMATQKEERITDVMDTQFKKLIPSIYLYEGKAVKGLGDLDTVSEDPAALAAQYDNGFTDALMIFDLSDSDSEQEMHNDIIRKICSSARIPVIAAGRVRRMEDIKKFLYAGCSMACLNLSKDSNAQIAQEVADKFGSDKIACCFSSKDQVAENKDLIDGNVCCLIYVGDEPLESLSGNWTDLPVIAQITENDCVRVSLSHEGINGVTGNGVNKRTGKLQFVRNKLLSSGIPVKVRTAAYEWGDFKLGPDGLLPVVVQDLTADCDMDTLLAKVEQIGAACHTGSHSCFFNKVLAEEGKEEFNPQTVLLRDYQTITDRRDHPKKGSYTNYLFDKGLDKMLKKLGEEATEIVIAAKNPNPNEIVYEISDYLYHLMVVMAEKGITWEDVTGELARRQKKED